MLWTGPVINIFFLTTSLSYITNLLAIKETSYFQWSMMRSARWFFKGRGYQSTSRRETDCSPSDRVLLEALSPRRTFSSLQCRNDQQVRKVGRYRSPTAHSVIGILTLL